MSSWREWMDKSDCSNLCFVWHIIWRILLMLVTFGGNVQVYILNGGIKTQWILVGVQNLLMEVSDLNLGCKCSDHFLHSWSSSMDCFAFSYSIVLTSTIVKMSLQFHGLFLLQSVRIFKRVTVDVLSRTSQGIFWVVGLEPELYF